MKNLYHPVKSKTKRSYIRVKYKDIVRVSPAMVTNARVGYEGVRVIMCDNMRVEGGRLRYVPRPEVIPMADNYYNHGGRLAAVVTHPQMGRICLFDRVDGDKAGWSLADSATMEIHPLCELKGTISDALLFDTSTIFMLTSAGTVKISVTDGNLYSEGIRGAVPEFKFTVTDCDTSSCTIEGGSLKGEYTDASTQLIPSDSASVTANFKACAEALLNGAADESKWGQAAMVRYRLRDYQGNTLFLSTPHFVAHPDGFSLMDEASSRITSDHSQYGGWKLYLNRFALKLCLPAENIKEGWKKEIADIVVETTPPLHPIDPSYLSIGTLRYRAAGAIDILYRPSYPTTEAGNCGDLRRAVIERIFAGGENAFIPIKVISADRFTPGAEFLIEPPLVMRKPWADQAAALKQAVKAQASTNQTHQGALCRWPHRWSASTAAVCGSDLVWGNISVDRYEGCPLSSLATTVVNQPWRGVMVVEMADGRRRCVVNEQGADNAPAALSGMMMYPASDAVRITAMIERGGQRYKLSLPLSISSSGMESYYLSPDGGEIKLIATDEPFPSRPDQSATDSLKGYCIVSNLDDPLLARYCIKTSEADVVKLIESPRRGSAWEGGHNRLYIMCSDGIRLMSVGENSLKCKTQIIDNRGVTSPRAVTATDIPSVPVAAIASGDLIAINRSTPSTIITGAGDCDLAWDRTHSDLWLLNHSEGYPRIIPNCGKAHFRLTSLTATRLFNSGTGILAENDEGLIHDTSRPIQGNCVGKVKWVAEIDAPAPASSTIPLRLSAIEADIYSSSHTPTLSVSGNFSRTPQPPVPAIVEPQPPASLPIITLGMQRDSRMITTAQSIVAPPLKKIRVDIDSVADTHLDIGDIILKFLS